MDEKIIPEKRNLTRKNGINLGKEKKRKRKRREKQVETKPRRSSEQIWEDDKRGEESKWKHFGRIVRDQTRSMVGS